MRRRLIFMIVAGLSFSLVASACVFRGTRTREVDLGQSFAIVASRAKAHLVDGTTVVYRDGFTLRNLSPTIPAPRWRWRARLGDDCREPN